MRVSRWVFPGAVGLLSLLSAVAAATGHGHAALVILPWAAGIVGGLTILIVGGWWIAWPARLRPPFRQIVDVVVGRADPPQ